METQSLQIAWIEEHHRLRLGTNVYVNVKDLGGDLALVERSRREAIGLKYRAAVGEVRRLTAEVERLREVRKAAGLLATACHAGGEIPEPEFENLWAALNLAEVAADASALLGTSRVEGEYL